MIILTQAEFDAVPVLAKQTAVPGLQIKKTDGDKWYLLDYGQSDAKGNFDITVNEIQIQGQTFYTDIQKTLNDLDARLKILEGKP